MTWHQTVAVGNLGGDPDLKFMQRRRRVQLQRRRQ